MIDQVILIVLILTFVILGLIFFPFGWKHDQTNKKNIKYYSD